MGTVKGVQGGALAPPLALVYEISGEETEKKFSKKIM